MSAFLLLLVKLNLAMGAAIVLVSLLRRPLRLLFGAPIAYAIWFLVPIAGFASLLPPRIAASTPVPTPPVHVVAAPISVMGHITHSALRVTEQLTGQSALPAIAAPPASAHAILDTALLLFATWALGTLLMALYLTRLQLRFSAAVRRGEAGPAVLGFFCPRIVTPDSFQEYFTPPEQAAILAHEHVHLARQDARINALAALLRCLCWFNPLIHLGARWLRIDQELACDASVVAGAISRRDYAEALLKSQIMVTSLPLGCNWPGSQHPLIERIALLQRKSPGTARRLAGMSLVLLAATSAGLGAWAAQPAVAAKPAAAAQPGMALARLAVMVAAPAQAGGSPSQSATHEDSTSSDAPENIGGGKATMEASVTAPMPGTGSSHARTDSAPLLQTASAPSNIIPDPSALPAGASPEPKDSLARNSVGTITNGDVAAAAATSDGPSLGTETAIACLLGMGRDGCEKAFVDADLSGNPAAYDMKSRIISSCSGKYIYRRLDYCPAGFLETVQYLGRNVGGDDVYLAQFAHGNATYVIPQPTPEGRLPQIWKFNDLPVRILLKKDLVELQAPVRAPRTIYSRNSSTVR